MAVLALAAAVRVGALLALRASPYADFLLFDERTYDAWARAVAGGTTFNVPDQSVLPAYLMAGIYRWCSPDPIAVRVLNVVWGILTVGCLAGIGRRLGGPRAGIATGLMAALYGPLVLHSITLLKEPVGLLLFSALVLLFVDELEEHRPPRAIALGAVGALVIDVRQNAVVVATLAFAWLAALAWRRGRSVRALAVVLLALGAGLLAASVPFMVRNHRQTGSLSSVPVSGFNLYLGNDLSNPVPYYRPAPFATNVPSEHAIHFVVEASRREGRGLTPAEASRYWEREVVHSAWKRPGAFAARLLEKALAVANRHEEADNHDFAFIGRFAPFFALPFLSFALVFPLGVAGLALAARRDGRLVALTALAAVYALTLVVVFSNMRIRLPLLVFLLPGAALALVRFSAWSRRERGVALAVAAGCTVLAFLPIAGGKDLAGQLNTHAVLLGEQGRVAEAQVYWRESSRRQESYSVYADAALGSVLAYEGRSSAAREQLARIPETSFAAAMKHDLLGDLAQQEQRWPEAAREWERSLQLDPAQRTTLRKLIEVYRAVAPDQVAPAQARLASLETFYAGRGAAP